MEINRVFFFFYEFRIVFHKNLFNGKINCEFFIKHPLTNRKLVKLLFLDFQTNSYKWCKLRLAPDYSRTLNLMKSLEIDEKTKDIYINMKYLKFSVGYWNVLYLCIGLYLVQPSILTPGL